MKNLRRRLLRRHNQRGSTLIIVLGVISLLILLVITLSFTAKLDTLAARNYQDLVQARVSATTGVARAASVLRANMPRGATSALELATLGSVATFEGATSATLDRERRPAAGYNIDPRTHAVMFSTPEFDLSVTDACGLVNVNTAPEELIAAVLDHAANRAGVKLDSQGFAAKLAAWRLGPDGKPGAPAQSRTGAPPKSTLEPAPEVRSALALHGASREGATVQSLRQPLDPAARRWDTRRAARLERAAEIFEKPLREGRYHADLRRPSEGDDRRLSDLSELVTTLGLDARVYREAAPFLTTFSVTEERYTDASGATHPLLDVNRASAENIHRALRSVYGGTKDDQLLRQFAANLVDARDPDRVPTRLAGADGTADVLGAERTPFLVEVYSQVRRITLQTNDGQYVQIFNPWAEPFDVTGWQLEGSGGRIVLSGTIAPNGYLIVTNDKDNSKDASGEPTPGEGSFYDIFGFAAAGPAKRLVEVRQLSLPTTRGRHEVRLVSPEGDLIDRFPFVIQQSDDHGMTAFKRTNPFVRDTVRGRATPFALGWEDTPEAAAGRMRLVSYPQDAPITRLTEILDVFQGFAQADGTPAARWAFPVAATPEASRGELAAAASDPTRIDARAIDIFTVESFERRSSEAIADNLRDLDRDGRLNGLRRPSVWDSDATLFGSASPADQFEEDWDRALEAPIGLRYGLVNLNTAPAEVIRALPGMDDAKAKSLLTRRAAALATAGGGDGALYRRPSDLLCDEGLWQGVADADRLEAFEELFSHTTFGSRSFVLVGRARSQATSQVESPMATEFRALVATDRAAADYVSVSGVK